MDFGIHSQCGFNSPEHSCLYCACVKCYHDPCLHLDGNQIKVVKEVKFLGVIFDCIVY